MTFRTYDDVIAHIDSLGLFHMDFGLDRIGRVLEALDLTRLPCAVVQVVGTNGKGSTSTFLASLGRAHGVRTGLYTSPHFITPRERIRIDGRMLEADLWPLLGNRILDAGGATLTYFEFLTVLGVLAFHEAGVGLAVIEAGLGGAWDATTALDTDLLCITPIGLDHQHVLGPTVGAIATDKAGAMRPGGTALTARQSEEALAALQSAAGAHGTTLVEARDRVVIPEGTTLGLAGPHQRGNATLALAAWCHIAEQQGWKRNEEAERRGLASAHIAGRFHRVCVDVPREGGMTAPVPPTEAPTAEGHASHRTASAQETTHTSAQHGSTTAPPPPAPSRLHGDRRHPTTGTTNLPMRKASPPAPPATVRHDDTEGGTPGTEPGTAHGTAHGTPSGTMHLILDGAHNAHGLTALRAALLAEGVRPSAVIFSCLADKDTEAIAPLLVDIASSAPLIIPTIADNERAADGSTLAARLGPGARAVPRLIDALHEAARLAPHATPETPVLLCGSLYLLAEFFTLRPDLLESPVEAHGCA